MVTLPPGPPKKSPEIDQKTRQKFVIDALLSLRSKANSKVAELERTDENQLTKLHRGEIISELERIHDRDRNTFRIMRAGHTVRTAAKPASVLTGYSEPQYQWAQWKEIPEKTPIVLALLDGFDNWCEAQLHKKSITVKDLSEQSRLKVLDTVSAIYQQFELTSNPKVLIDWVPPNETKNAAARQLSLQFLENQDVVKRHQFHYDGGGQIEVEIDVKEFFRFRDELLALCSPTISDQETPPDTPKPSVASNSFASIEHLKWQDISIRFLDGHTVKISARDTSLTADYRQMGFEDARNRLPNTQWSLMKILAENKGQIGWEDSEASDNIKKKKQLLSDTLKAFFQIDDDPFYPYRDERAYRTKFTLRAEND